MYTHVATECTHTLLLDVHPCCYWIYKNWKCTNWKYTKLEIYNHVLPNVQKLEMYKFGDVQTGDVQNLEMYNHVLPDVQPRATECKKKICRNLSTLDLVLKISTRVA